MPYLSLSTDDWNKLDFRRRQSIVREERFSQRAIHDYNDKIRKSLYRHLISSPLFLVCFRILSVTFKNMEDLKPVE